MTLVRNNPMIECNIELSWTELHESDFGPDVEKQLQSKQETLSFLATF